MKKLLFIVCMIAGSIRLNCQHVEEVLNINNHYYRPISVRTAPLFNTDEIKTKGIRSCMITRPFLYNHNTDTLFIFNFDRNGNIEREIRFMNGYMARRDTINGPRSEKRYYSRIDSIVEYISGQKIVTKYYVWPFNWEKPEDDTGYIKRIVYDDKNRMVEFKMDGTPDFLEMSHCGTGITFDIQYRYNEKGDLIYFHDRHWRQYMVYAHYPQRKVVRIYDARTNKLETKFTVRITNNDRKIIEKDDLITTLTRLDKGSNLFSKLSSKQIGKMGKGTLPNDYLLVYEYYNDPLPKEKLIVTK